MRSGSVSPPVVNTVYKTVAIDASKLELHELPLMKKGATGLDLVTPYFLAIEQLSLCNADKISLLPAAGKPY